MSEEAKENIVVTLPDGSDHFYEIKYRYGLYPSKSDEIKRACAEAVRDSGVTRKRGEEGKVEARVFTMKIEKGKIANTFWGNILIDPPAAPMTDAEFKEEMASLLNDVPAEFHAFINEVAWDEGHAGYDEVVSTATELIENLMPCVKKFEARLKGKGG